MLDYLRIHLERINGDISNGTFVTGRLFYDSVWHFNCDKYIRQPTAYPSYLRCQLIEFPSQITIKLTQV